MTTAGTSRPVVREAVPPGVPTAWARRVRLIRLAGRRDRVVGPVWVLACAATTASLVGAFDALYPDAASRAEFARTLGALPASIAMYGPITDTSLGALVVWRAGLVVLIAALAAAFTVIRHSRADEDSTRADLLAGSIDRAEPLVAAVAWTAILLVALFIAQALALTVAGVGGPGAWWAAATTSATGLAAAGFAALVAQLVGARTARGAVGALLAAAFASRAAGDLAADGSLLDRLAWLSPLRWSTVVDPYGAARPGPVLALIALGVVTGVTATRVAARRDAGYRWRDRDSGPAQGRAHSVEALWWRLIRATLGGWAIGVALLGVLAGGTADSLSTGLAEDPDLRDLLGRLGGPGSAADAYLATVAIVTAMLAAAATLQLLLMAGRQETDGPAAVVLATRVDRRRWHAVTQLSTAVVIPLVLLVAAGVAASGARLAATGHASADTLAVVGAFVAPVPAVWLITALAVLLHAVAPRAAAAGAWGVLVGSVLITEVLQPLAPDNPLTLLSPFTHLPRLPGGDLVWTPLVIMTAVAGGVLVVSIPLYRRRDLLT